MIEILNSFGINIHLVATTLFFMLLSFVSFARYIETLPLLFLIILKYSIPFFYFVFFAGDAWFLVDDIEYFLYAKTIVEKEIPFISSETLYELFLLAGGPHILYLWLNFVLQNIFGTYYYVMIFFNIYLTFVLGYLLHKVARDLNFSKKYSLGLFCFFLLHWDILTWTSFINLKDTIVMVLSTALLIICINLYSKITPFRLLIFLCLLAMISLLRFYVPILIFCSLLVSITLFRSSYFKKILMMFFSMALFIIYLENYSATFTRHAGMIEYSPINVLFGFLRFLLTPQPWNLSDSYGFLLYSSIMHSLFFIPFVWGSYLLFKKNNVIKFYIVYMLVVACFYSLVPDLQGPRHRYQLVTVICWAQFHFLYSVLNSYYSKIKINRPERGKIE